MLHIVLLLVPLIMEHLTFTIIKKHTLKSIPKIDSLQTNLQADA
jgi:hypothetical protein